MKTEGLEKKLSEILDELHKYSPYAWEQMVSYEFASAVTGTSFSLAILAVALFGVRWVYKKSDSDPDLVAPLAWITIVMLIVICTIVGCQIPSLFFPEAAVLRSIFK